MDYSTFANGLYINERIEINKKSKNRIIGNNERLWDTWKNTIPDELKNEYLNMLFGKDVETEDELKAILLQHIDTYSFLNRKNKIKKIFQIYNNNKVLNVDIILKYGINDKRLLSPFYPVILFAFNELQKQLQKKNQSHFANSLRIIEEIFLNNYLDLLYNFVEKTLILELHVAKHNNELNGETPEERFDSFIKILQNETKIETLMAEYPLLFRIVYCITDHWLLNSKKILNRLNDDWIEICLKFNINKNSNLLKIDFGKGDNHNKGQTVCILSFEENKKIVYKPRNLNIDSLYEKISDLLNTCANKQIFPILKTLQKKKYGWAEFINHSKSSNIDDLDEYYYRFGCLIALIYALNGSDFHFENIIASNGFPYAVDLECLFTHHVRSAKVDPVLTIDTVLNSFLLPFKLFFEDGVMVNIGAFATDELKETPTAVSKITGGNTDNMRFIREKIKIDEVQTHIPLHKIKIDITTFEPKITTGFEQTYESIMQNKTALLKIVKNYKNAIIRVLLRNTSYYSDLVKITSHPNNLRDALTYDARLNHLLNNINDIPALKSVVMFEKKHLENLDIPAFYTKINSRHLYDEQGILIKDFFDENSLEKFKKKLNTLNLIDCNRQIWLIRAKLISIKEPAEYYHLDKRNVITFKKSNNILLKNTLSLKLIKITENIAKKIVSLSFIKLDNISWYNFYATNKEGVEVALMDESIYQGMSGIAIFFGSLYKITKNKSYLEIFEMALNSIKNILKNDIITNRLGIFDGFTSVIYLYFYIGKLLDRQDLIETGKELINELDTKINNLKAVDIVSGVSGIVILLSEINQKYLIHITPLLSKLQKKLLENYQETENGAMWMNSSDTSEGLAHGNFGVALCLYELYLFYKDEKWLDLYNKTMYYEEYIAKQPKKSLTNSLIKPSPHYWCNGTAGYGLGMIKLLKKGLKDEGLYKKIDDYTNEILEFGIKHNHCLCHGSLGNLEFLLQASQIRNDTDLENTIYRYIDGIADNIENHGILTGSMFDIEHPGFMTGMSGIGFQLLRFSNPNIFPSILSIDI